MGVRFVCTYCPDFLGEVVDDVTDHVRLTHPGEPVSRFLAVAPTVRPQSSYEAHCRRCAAPVVRTTPFPTDVVVCAACEAAR